MDETDRSRFLARCASNPNAEDLEREEQAIYMAAKSGSLFEADMSEEDWEQFLFASEIEETERAAGTPKSHSRLTEAQRSLLSDAQIPKSKVIQRTLTKRRELIERARPECVDADGSELAEEAAKDIEKEFGLSEADWGQIDTSLGAK
jgi:hypothetical protein